MNLLTCEHILHSIILNGHRETLETISRFPSEAIVEHAKNYLISSYYVELVKLTKYIRHEDGTFTSLALEPITEPEVLPEEIIEMRKPVIEHFARNKLLVLQWKLRKLIGKRIAKRITMAIEHLLLH